MKRKEQPIIYSSKIVQLRNISEIIRDDESVRNRVFFLLEKDHLALFDEKNNLISPGITSNGKKRIIWTKTSPPLRNTGWIPKKTKLMIYSNNEKHDFFYPYPWIKKVVLPSHSYPEAITLKGYTQITSRTQWDKKQDVVLQYFRLDNGVMLRFRDMYRCVTYQSNGYRLIKCDKNYVVYDARSSFPEYLIRTDNTEIHIEQPVCNPIIEWLQPYSIVEDKIYPSEQIVSNFIVISYPGKTITLASNKPIKYTNMNGEAIITSHYPFYIQIGRQPSYNMLSNIRILQDPPIRMPVDIPKLQLSDQSIFIQKQELIKEKSYWKVVMKIANVLESNKMIRIRIPPPHYIYMVEVYSADNKEELFIEDPNYMVIPITGKTSHTIVLTIKEKNIRRIFVKD